MREWFLSWNFPFVGKKKPVAPGDSRPEKHCYDAGCPTQTPSRGRRRPPHGIEPWSPTALSGLPGFLSGRERSREPRRAVFPALLRRGRRSRWSRFRERRMKKRRFSSAVGRADGRALTRPSRLTSGP